MNGADPAPPLIFADLRRSRRLGTLAVLLVVSLLLHAVSFYILQVAYTPTVTLPPPPAEVTLLAPGSEENRALHRWLAIADPALITQPSSPRDDFATLSFRYVPSYAAASPGYRPLAITAPAGPLPAGDLFGPAPLPPLPAPNRPPAPSPPSQLTLAPELAALAVEPLAPLSLSLRGAAGVKSLEPSVFLVGAREEGGAPFVFRQTPSGNAVADEYARDYLARLRLAPAPHAPWGWATFHWGVDVFR